MSLSDKITSCIICNKEFIKNTYNRALCSEKCAEQRARIKDKERSRKRLRGYGSGICLVCEKVYLKNKNTQKYCSRKCVLKQKNDCTKKLYLEKTKNKKRKKAVYKNLKCTICNKEFIPVSRSQLKCSPECIEVYKQSEEFKYQRSRYSTDRYSSNINFKISITIRNSVKRILKIHTKTGNTKDFVDYTPEQLKNHLESLWQVGMSWENYGLYGWHIDHMRPLASYNFIREDGTLNELEIKKATDLQNLQPLWAIDNLIKGAKYELSD